MSRYEHESGGFVLLSLLIFLLATGTLVALTFLGEYAIAQAQRGRDTANMLSDVYLAITGTPSNGTFGYLGDVGQLPNSVFDLVRAPVDQSGVPLPGWSGPYLTNPSIVSSMLMDAYGNPFEYFQTTNASGDQLAIISQGPDHSSTNTAANPNVAAQFSGTLPSDPTYATAGAGVNADNLAFPNFVQNIAALSYTKTGTLAYNIYNYDQNSAVKASVPACPNLYGITITSVPRGYADTRTISFTPGTAIQMVQGVYDVTITSQVWASPFLKERVTILPNLTTTRTVQAFPINSSNGNINEFLLTVTNNGTSDLDIYEFKSKLGTVKKGQAVTFSSVEGCSSIYAYPAGKTTPTVASFVMPFNNYSLTIGTTGQFTLTVQNLDGESSGDATVYANGVQIGTAPHLTTQSISNVQAGAAITIIELNGSTVASFTMPGSNYSITIE